MDMTNIEKVVKAIQDKKYNIIHYPTRAYIDIEDIGYKRFYGSIVEFERVLSIGQSRYILFIADKEDSSQLHNGYSLLNDRSIPDILWFKKSYDRVTILGEFYI